ncbi:hypothetical protein [Methanocaldococcus vulcanius]|nr:hypothetical protein [Methanocaldococcus vulcanius]
MEKYEIPKEIGEMMFGLLSPDYIRQMSVAKIVTPDTYDEDGYPIDGGLMDPRLGVIDPGLVCKTCGGRIGECPGHFGHIELAKPVIHIGFAKTIYKILKAVCPHCGRVAISETKRKEILEKMEKLERDGGNKWEVCEEVYKEASKITVCPHCGEMKYDIKFEKPTTYYKIDGNEEKTLTPSDVREILEKIPDEDCILLGINPEVARPEWMVLTVLPVPPVTVRPSITLDTGERSEDDLTHKLVDIIRINNRLEENIEGGAPNLIIEDLWNLLQYHINTYFDNEAPGIPPAKHRSGRPLKTLAQRLKGKEGRFRYNLAGKRVNFSSRTVISPDPCLSVNEVGVPEIIAKELTVPEKVTKYNIERIRKLLRNGSEKHPGVNYVIRKMIGRDGTEQEYKVKVTEGNKEFWAENIKEGDIVERHLMDGDIVLYNRQPSLHRMSIMAHRVRVLPYRTFRHNLCVCVDGDTTVLLDGKLIKIKDLEDKWKDVKVLTSDNLNPKLTALSNYWKLKADEYGKKIYKIKTELGREIIATEDHPFYTTNGKKRCGDLKVDDELIIYPNDFPMFEDDNRVIVNEEKIKKVIDDIGGTYKNKVINELKDRKLIPLTYNDQKASILARIVGHVMGDGSLIINNKNSRVVFRGDIEDLKTIKEDLKELGYDGEEIKLHEGETEITDYNGRKRIIKGKCYSFEVRKKSLCILLKALGCVDGDKTKKMYGIPNWIKTAPKYIKKEFLSAYFGSELTTPKIRNHGTSFKELTFKIAKIEEIFDEDRFIKDIKEMLKEFGIELKVRVEEGNLRKDGYKTKVYVASIYNHKEFFGRIGYTYANKKETLARYAYEYLLTKEKYLKDRNIKKLENNTKFITFDEFIKEKCLKNGFVKEKIVSIEETKVDYVYDITTTSETHNFIANGFLTGNCPPYNADFDGDEMNLHVPQSEEARAEAEALMLVEKHILSPRFGGPIIGAIHDFISGAYLLTSNYFTKDEATLILRSGGIKDELWEPDKVENGIPLYSGKKIFSKALPKGLNLRYKAKICKKCDVCKKENCEYDAYVVIKDGELIKGVIDKNGYGSEAGLILHTIVKEFGPEAGRKFLDSSTKMAIRAIMLRGFTTGIDDEDLPEEALKEIEKVLDEAEEKVNEIIEKYKRGELELLPGLDLEESREAHINNVLREARDKAGKIAEKHLGMDNHAVIMALTGARGNILNLTQMAACLGQQSVRGRRIFRGYRGRVLPHFEKGDLGARSHGFVRSSYKKGLSPTEFFFHAMGGREGLVDQAVRTAQSGYMQRRLINALQDLKTEFDETVRDSRGIMIQFKYGEDGVDPTLADRGKAVNISRIIDKVKMRYNK